MEFASDRDVEGELELAMAGLHSPRAIDDAALVWFDSEVAAVAAGCAQYSEYGVEIDTEDDASADTFANRLSVVAELFDERLGAEFGFSARGDQCVVVGIGPFELTVRARDGAQAENYVDWLMATTPAALAAGLAGEAA
jgi:hypothetical protein